MVLRGAALLLLLLSGPPALAADRPAQVHEGRVSRIEVAPGLDVDRALVRDIQRVVRTTLSRAVKRLGLTTEDVLSFPHGVPAWYRPDEAPGKRIRIAIGENDVTAGAKTLTPAQVHEIARRTALGVIRRTVGQAIPLWMESGLCDGIANDILEGASPVVAGFRKDLAARDFGLEWMALLHEARIGSFTMNRGRALGWALVLVLKEGGTVVVEVAFRRARELVRHLSRTSERLLADDLVLRREFTAVAERMLTPTSIAIWDPERAVRAWVAAGFPTGREFRASPAASALRGLEVPPGELRVSLKGAFDMPYDDHGIKYRILKEPRVKWWLPWPSEMALYVGIRGMRAGSVRFDPTARNKGRMGTHEKLRWSAKTSGDKTFKWGVNIRYKPGTDRFGFMLLAVKSPYGVDYSFFHEWELK